MSSNKRIFLCHILLVLVLTLEAVKIGISKPLSITTTIGPNTTIIEITNMDTTDMTTASAITTTTKLTTNSATTKTNTEAEWPEFPPKKTSKNLNKTTTKKPTTTTIKPLTTTINYTKLNKEHNITLKPETTVISFQQRPPKHGYCFCDLNRDVCDINCCCDRDCSPDVLKVFRCLLEKPIDLEVYEGRFEYFKFQHGLPSCETNNGWLCVFRTYKPLIKEEKTVNYEDTSRYYKWPNLLFESEAIKSREFYKYGDILRVINIETKEIQNFDLPSSFKPPSCQILEPIYHLKSVKRTCLISSYERLKEIQHNLLHFQQNYKIFKKPTIPDDLHNNKDLHNYIGNITANQCIENDKNCTIYSYNIEKNLYEELFKVKIKILHNFTHIQEMILDLWFKNTGDLNLDDQSFEYWLMYEIEFLNKTIKELNSTKQLKNIKKSHNIVSGPLGYLPGKPLILARYEPVNKTLPLSVKNQVINYFLENNNASHTLALFAKENGECKRLNSNKEYISFGINAAKHCKIKVDNGSLLWEEPTKTNFTKMCLNLQQRIHDQLFGEDISISDLTSYMISQLGKPENNSNKWLQLQVFNTDFNSVFGQYLQETNTFICRNILLGLSYEFHMAMNTVDNVPWQNVIKYAALNLAERHDLEFALDENLEVPITMTIRFFDAHEKSLSAAGIFQSLSLAYIILNLVLTINI